MVTVSQHFQLGKPQAALDFVDVPINADIPLFVDPFAISMRPDRWSQECHSDIVNFFDRLIQAIRSGREERARDLLIFLSEPNETHLGFSSGAPRGAGIGKFQSQAILEALKASGAVKSGFLKSLEECELLVEGIGRDKISDLTTNIIRFRLAGYTSRQAALHNIPVQSCGLNPYYESESGTWRTEFFELPVVRNKPLLFVPRVFARRDASYDHWDYYNKHVLTTLQSEHLSASSSLVTALKNGRRVVFKKDLRARFPCTKEYLLDFSKRQPQVLKEYREKLKTIVRNGDEIPFSEQNIVASALQQALRSISPGAPEASGYHSLMVGVVEFLFFPSLINPRKEKEIHDGRKRIDIVMENGAFEGIFERLARIHEIPCAYIAIECKNYTNEAGNPELDQISSRFSTNRGKVGFLCVRRFENRKLFIDRCRDTFRDNRGLILPFDDEKVLSLLELIKNHKRSEIDAVIADLISEIILN